MVAGYDRGWVLQRSGHYSIDVIDRSASCEGTIALICSLATRQTLNDAGAKASGPEIVTRQGEMPVEGEAGSLSESFQAELIRCEK
jgi:hypothetical protein